MNGSNVSVPTDSTTPDRPEGRALRIPDHFSRKSVDWKCWLTKEYKAPLTDPTSRPRKEMSWSWPERCAPDGNAVNMAAIKCRVSIGSVDGSTGVTIAVVCCAICCACNKSVRVFRETLASAFDKGSLSNTVTGTSCFR